MVSVGLGYTTLPDPRAAASQITDQAQLALGVKPSLAILLSTVGYDLNILVGMVQDCLGDTPLWGGTSSSGVFTRSGWITGEKGAAALMLLAGFPAGVNYTGDNDSGIIFLQNQTGSGCKIRLILIHDCHSGWQ